MIETEELICKKVHMPWPNVRIPAGEKIAVGPKWLVDALCARGFFERINGVSGEAVKVETAGDPVVESEVKPPDEQSRPKFGKKGK